MICIIHLGDWEPCRGPNQAWIELQIGWKKPYIRRRGPRVAEMLGPNSLIQAPALLPPAVCLWTSCSTSLGFGFLSCKMG